VRALLVEVQLADPQTTKELADRQQCRMKGDNIRSGRLGAELGRNLLALLVQCGGAGTQHRGLAMALGDRVD
jgi:hypothetical protein